MQFITFTNLHTLCEDMTCEVKSRWGDERNFRVDFEDRQKIEQMFFKNMTFWETMFVEATNSVFFTRLVLK